MNINKEKLKDTMGRPLTQSLFLEIGYETDKAVFTLKDQDHVYEGVTYPSLKRLFLEMEDIVEYDFASEYLLNWQHWQRLNKNKVLAKHFAEWREELELRIRSQSVRGILDMSTDSFQALKWISDKGWDKKSAGRPSKKEKLQEERMQQRLEEEFNDDVVRLLKA